MAPEEAGTAYVYAFVRRDLSPSEQAVQACHACIEAARSLLSPCDEHPHLVLCGVRSEARLWGVLKRLEGLGIPCRPFRDSDLEGRLTAVATGPVRGSLRRRFRRYRCLRLKEEGG